MKQELSAFKKTLLVGLLAIIIIISIFFVTKFTIGKSLTDLKNENAQLKTEYETLKVYLVSLDQYKKDMVNYINTINEQIQDFDITTSDSSLLHEYEEDLSSAEFTTHTLTLNPPLELNLIQYESDGNNFEYSLQSTEVAISYSCNYSKLLEYIHILPENNKNEYISSITLVPDSKTGNITGTLLLNKYTINGGIREFVEPNIDRELGVDQVLVSDAP